MKILLKQNIDSVGRMGEVVDVAGGYARNFLIPRDLAVGVTRGRIKEIEEQQKVLEVKAARQREQVEELAGKMRSKRIVLKARCSATGKLFGSITNRQLAREIAEQTGEEVDRHKIIVDEHIKSVGNHHASIKLHPDVVLDLEFEVEGEGFVGEEPQGSEPQQAAEPQRAPADKAELNASTTAESDAEQASLDIDVKDEEEQTQK